MHAVVAAPCSANGWAETSGSVSLVAQTAVLAASGCQATLLAVLVDGVDNPVCAWVVADRWVLRVSADDFVPREDAVGVGPVAVEDAQVAEPVSEALLSDGAVVLVELQSSDTACLWFAECDALVRNSLAATAADADAEDGEALLGLPAQHACLVWACWVAEANDVVRVAVLPRTDALSELHHISSLPLPELVHVHECAHFFVFLVSTFFFVDWEKKWKEKFLRL